MLEPYLRLLICVARADGSIATEEALIIENAALRAGISAQFAEELRAMMASSCVVDTDAVIHTVVSEIKGVAWSASGAARLAETVRDCYVMAAADGEISPSEIAIISRLLDIASVPPQRRATLLQWGESAARASVDGTGLFIETLVAPP